MVTLIDEAIEDILGSKYEQVSVNGRSFTKHDLADLRLMREYYQRQALVTATTTPRGLRISPIHNGGTVPKTGQS